MRTDDVRPTSEIIEPKQKRIRELDMKITWQGSDNISSDSELAYSYRFDDGEWSEFIPDTELVTQSLPDGDHTFEVRAEDIAGNLQDPPAKITFNTNEVAPKTTITTQAPGAAIAERSFTLEFEAKDNTDTSENLEYEVKLDNGGWEKAQSPTQHRFERLANGRHILAVRAKDRAGNVDATPPALTLEVQIGIEVVFNVVPEPRTSKEPIQYTWEGKDAAGASANFAYFMKVDNEEKSLGNVTSVDLPELPEGEHTVSLWAVDSAGNRSNELSHTFFIDRTQPTTFASFKGTYTTSKYPQIQLKGEDLPADKDGQPHRVSLFEYRYDDNPQWSETLVEIGDTWNSDRKLSMFDWGYILHVRARDEAGLIGNEVSVDLTLPKRSPILVYSVAGVAGVVGSIHSLQNSRRTRTEKTSIGGFRPCGGDARQQLRSLRFRRKRIIGRYAE